MEFNNYKHSYNYLWWLGCSCGNLSWLGLFMGSDMYGYGLNNFFLMISGLIMVWFVTGLVCYLFVLVVCYVV